MFISQYGLRVWLASKVVLFCCLLSPAVAQDHVIPDGTTATPNPGSCDPSCTVIGGTTDITGTNLFHSFTKFSVPTGGTVIFDHDPTIRNILTRVTGNNSRSEINGIIRTDTNSSTNLFLLNPNGIVFGPNGGLDIGGSFVVTTADALQFQGQGLFSASDTTNNLGLLTVIPSAFLFNRITPEPIINQSMAEIPSLPGFSGGLSVQEQNSLILLGGDIILAPSPGDLFGGFLTAPSGQIELGGLAGPGTVSLIGSGNDLSLSYDNNIPLANVSLSSADLMISSFFGNAAGSVTINADHLVLADNSSIASTTFTPENSGDIRIRANSSVSLESSSNILSFTFGPGSGGNIEIITNRFFLDDTSGLTVSTFGSGNAGTISIDAELVSLSDNSLITSDSFGFLEPAGNPGEIEIVTGTLLLTDNSQLTILTVGDALDTQASGLIDIDARETVVLSSGSLITSNTFGQRDAGSVEISSGNLIIQDTAGILAAAVTDASSAAGKIELDTQTLTLVDGAQITSSTQGDGNAGTIFINNGQIVSISDSLISTETNATGAGGSIKIISQQLIAADNASISARSTSSGSAGDILIQTDGQFKVENGAQLEVSGESTGDSGMLGVLAGLVILDGGQLLASVQAGEDGNIELDIDDALILRGDSLISAEAFNDANGGNVDITTPFIIALFPDGPNANGNDIRASADAGDGGRITIQANTLFNIAENQAVDDNMTNDLDATSGTGIDGEVIISTLEVDPDEVTLRLPPSLGEPEVSQGCQAGGDVNGRFLNAGQGGLSPNPYESLSGDGIQEDILPVGQSIAQVADPPVAENSSESIVEAQAWGRNVQGDIVLVTEQSVYQSACQRSFAGAS